MLKNKKLGNIGEQFVVDYLERKSYKILERNFYSKFGEIDIVAMDGKVVVFVEVKTRSGVEFGYPSESVNKIKQRHMFKTAQYYLYKLKLMDSFVRFDVVEVLIKNGKFNVNHIKQIM